ncbi:MAG TPA: hypothetical protein VIK62_04905 [Verrucomicrobiae bacterium]
MNFTTALPFEVSEFENLLRKPNARFFRRKILRRTKWSCPASATVCFAERDHGEFQPARAQEIQRRREGCLALEMTGAERFDFGVPDDFVASVQAFCHSP